MEREFLGVWIPKEIYLNKELTPTDKLLLAEITSLAKNGECFASNQHFSEFLGISKSQVSRLITKLVRLNFISVVITYKELTKEVDKRVITPIGVKADTPTHGRVYPLRMEAHTPTHERVDPMRVDAYYKEQVKEQYKEQVKDIKKTKQKNVSAELENEFELLWKKYPRKLGKANALKAYIKARKGNKTTYETIENGLYRYIDYLKASGTDEQYIMHGSTWFNQEKWLDEYTVVGLNRKPKSAIEAYNMMYGGEQGEHSRSGEVIDYYPDHLQEPFQGF